jgi:hypothetical protein
MARLVHTYRHDAVGQVEGLLHTIPVMDVDVDVQNSRMHLMIGRDGNLDEETWTKKPGRRNLDEETWTKKHPSNCLVGSTKTGEMHACPFTGGTHTLSSSKMASTMSLQ